MKLSAFCIVLIASFCLGVPSHVWAQSAVTLHHDGGWCWFEDERALIAGDRLIVGTVADGWNPDGSPNPQRRGNIEVTVVDLETLKPISTAVLHSSLQGDDHTSPALILFPAGQLLAMYAKHGRENKIYYRIATAPYDASSWLDEKVFIPSESSRITYSNLHWLSEENDGQGRIYDFFRGLNNSFKPSVIHSDDLARTWKVDGVLIQERRDRRVRPYVKYANDGRRRIHFAFTDGHPRDINNSIYHAYMENGKLYTTNGRFIRELSDGPIKPSEATKVFQGGANNVAWISDLHLDENGYPALVYSVQKDSAGPPPGRGGEDHRYRYARWTGNEWRDQEIAYAGSRLYAGEDDYTGNICLNPGRLNEAFISTNVDPDSGKPLSSGHYEIFRGVADDAGSHWKWSPVTRDSIEDNLRPIVPIPSGDKNVLLWLRGTYKSYQNFDLDVMGMTLIE